MNEYIAYSWQQEAWIWFGKESSFCVSMTPEGNQDDFDLNFSSEEEFWEWYYE